MKTLAQPDSRLPLYQQLKEMFLDEISSGGWKIGTTIPSELEIATRFNVSRATVRQAIMDLVHAGHLRRIQGKGTIVTEAKIEPLAALTSFSENMKAAGNHSWMANFRGRMEISATADRGKAPATDSVAPSTSNGCCWETTARWPCKKPGIPSWLIDPHKDLFTKEYLDQHSLYETLRTTLRSRFAYGGRNH